MGGDGGKNSGRGVFLAIENAHWMDFNSLRILVDLTQHIDYCPILFGFTLHAKGFFFFFCFVLFFFIIFYFFFFF